MSDILNLDVDLDDLTIDEIDAVEQITGDALDSFGAAGKPRAALLRALAVVVKHREDAAEYPIGTADDIAESKRKVGRFRLQAPADAPDGAGNDEAAEAPPVVVASESPDPLVS